MGGSEGGDLEVLLLLISDTCIIIIMHLIIVWIWTFLYFHILCMRAANALARLHRLSWAR